jgi:CheY-like chemotaxis protein
VAPLSGLAIRAETETGTALKSKKILLVDDDEVILQTTSMKLKAAGYEVVTTTDPGEAIGKAGEIKPDVVLLDVHFPPDMSGPSWDGFRLMYWLRGLANTAGTRYLIISGSQTEQLRDRALANGASEFFPKPIDHSLLLRVLERELSGGAPKRN